MLKWCGSIYLILFLCVCFVRFSFSFFLRQKPLSAKSKKGSRVFKNVYFVLPAMNAPFTTPRRHSEKIETLTLALDFQKSDGTTNHDVARPLLNNVEKAIQRVIKPLQRKTIQAREHLKHPLLKPGATPDKDRIYLKFHPKSLQFELENGETVSHHDIDFQKFFVQPVVHLKDVWRFNGLCYPRLFIQKCRLFEKDVHIDTDTDVDEETEGSDGEDVKGTLLSSPERKQPKANKSRVNRKLLMSDSDDDDYDAEDEGDTSLRLAGDLTTEMNAFLDKSSSSSSSSSSGSNNKAPKVEKSQDQVDIMSLEPPVLTRTLSKVWNWTFRYLMLRVLVSLANFVVGLLCLGIIQN